MPENNHFETAMMQKMEGFLVEPAPSDWQAIYDRLHSRKKRRIIWWWFLPLVAILGAGIYWISMENDDVKEVPSVVVSSGNNNSAKQPNAQAGQPSQKIVLEEKEPVSKNVAEESSISTKNSTTSISTHPSKNQEVIKISTTRSRMDQKINRQPGKNNLHSGLVTSKVPSNDNSASSPVPLVKDKKTERQQQPDNDQSVAGIENNAQVNTAQPGNTPVDSIARVQKLDSGKMIVDAGQQVKETTTIPVKNKDRNWRLSAYLGAGPNYATDPIHLMPSALMADVSTPNSSSGGSRTYTNTSNNGGWHFSAGMAAEKNLGKKWLFMTGLGINSSTWSVTVEKYKDSLSLGSLTSTYKLSTEKNKNKLLMVEIPLQFSNRIAGKKSGSLWWTVGINNQFRLKYSQQSTTDSISGVSMADYRVMTSTARFYQPQFRLGLMYNHTGKVHWQLQPLFQYTLTGVYNSGGSDGPVLTNLQLQYRLFLQGKSKGEKPSK